MKSKLSRIIYYVVFIIALLFVRECSKSFTRNIFNSLKHKTSYEDSLNNFLKSFPLIQDSLTNNINKINELYKNKYDLKCDSISFKVSDTSLSYFYTFQKNRIEEMDLVVAREYIGHSVDSIVDNSESFELFRRFNTNIYYSYYDKNGKLIVKVKGKYKKQH